MGRAPGLPRPCRYPGSRNAPKPRPVPTPTPPARFPLPPRPPPTARTRPLALPDRNFFRTAVRNQRGVFSRTPKKYREPAGRIPDGSAVVDEGAISCGGVVYEECYPTLVASRRPAFVDKDAIAGVRAVAKADLGRNAGAVAAVSIDSLAACSRTITKKKSPKSRMPGPLA